jgi:hypothetical protein
MIEGIFSFETVARLSHSAEDAAYFESKASAIRTPTTYPPRRPGTSARG